VKLPRRQFLHLAAALPRSRPRASPPHKATRRVQYASWSVLPRVSRPTPDGYTLFLATPANAINATLYPSLNFNFMRDTAPVAGICLGPYVMVVNPMLPTTTVADFIAYARANPGKVNMASAGNGTPPHVFGELFKMMAGVDLVHVPYRSQLHARPAGRAGTGVVQFRTGIDRVNPYRQAARACGDAIEAPADVVARLTAQWLSERLNQQFVVDNRPGAGTNIAAEGVIRSASKAGSATVALISLLSTFTIATGVFRGAEMPYQLLAS
jgi:tripartite-type tricarboxylate transporter receptor subunit TctC